MDQTFIKDLLIRGIIGINESERTQKQDILINICLYGDISKAGISDDIADCINYRTVAKKVIAYVEHSSRFTVEALAADIMRLCLEEPGVSSARVRVEKPGAVRFAQSVGVEILRSREENHPPQHQAYISIGSNINPDENVIKAIQLLRESVIVNAVSSVWETEPVGTTGPHFLNASAWISTSYNPEELKEKVLRPIEEHLGRMRSEDKYAPRTIDLDILIYEEQVLDPALWQRDFLAIPTNELRPDLVEPGSGRTLKQIVQSIKSTSRAIHRPDLTQLG